MQNGRLIAVGLAACLTALAGPRSAHADDLPVPRPPPPPAPRTAAPLGAPAARGQVPVPDVRRMNESQAGRALAALGLRVGGVERVSAARLLQETGRHYSPGVVVQQAPPPSLSGRPQWLARGGGVWLRVAAPDSSAPRPRAPTPRVRPVAPAAPRVAPPVARRPSTRSVPSGRGTPRPPPPPYGLDGAPSVVRPPSSQPVQPRQPVQPMPGTPPYQAQPAPPSQPLDAASPLYDASSSARPGGFAPACACDPAAAGIVGDIRTSISLPCERKRSRWHARAIGGWAFSAGTDSGDSGFLAGFDIGRTFSGCIGVDLYYRYTAQTFDRIVPGGVLEDAGGFHHLGLVANYQASFNRNSRFYWYVGLGLGWYESADYESGGGGFEGYFQGGLGYMLTNKMRLRFGLDAFADDTKVGRLDPTVDGGSRLLWIVSPSLSLEFDF